MGENDLLAAEFERHRARLRAVAYRMLGTVSDADDAVQESWLRLSRSEPEAIANLPGYVDHIRHLKQERGEDLGDAVIAAPDLGASKYARRIRKAIGSRYQIAIVDKERDNGATRPLDVIGEPVKGRRVIMFDDIIDTGGSILGAAQRLQDEGALDVELRCTHGLFNGDAVQRFRGAGLRVVMLDTVSRPQSFHESERSWLTILPIDDMLAAAMHQTMQVAGSVSQLVR